MLIVFVQLLSLESLVELANYRLPGVRNDALDRFRLPVRFVVGHDAPPEVARSLEISEGTVASRLLRARTRFHAALKRLCARPRRRT